MRVASSRSAEDRTLAGATRFGVITCIGTLVFALLVMLTEQAGVPRQYAFILTGVLLVCGIAVPAAQTRTMSLADWMVAGRNAGSVVTAMALAASVTTGWTLAMIAGQFFARSMAAAAWIAGPLLGIAAAALLVLPFIRKSGAVTPAEYLTTRLQDRVAGKGFAALAVVSGILLLWSHLGVAGAVAAMLLPVDRQTATVGAAFLTGLAVLPGGLRGMIRVNALIFAFVATAYLAPLIWLSVTLTGLPVPQLSYGHGALEAVAEIEARLRAAGLDHLAHQVDGAVLSGISSAGAAALGLFLAAGLCAMPFVLGHFPSSRGPAQTRRTGGWSILMVALVLSAAPALAAFAKLGLYNNLLGLSVSDTIAGAEWLLAWGGRESLASAEPMARLCGQTVSDPAGAVAACGGNPDYAIGPADVRLSAETVTLAFARMIGLPLVFGALVGAAVVATAIAGANAVSMSIASTASRDLLARSANRPRSFMEGLFGGRVSLALALGAVTWLAVRFTPDPLETSLWATAIGAGAMAPVLVGSIWWDRMTGRGAAGGIAAGSLILVAHASLALLGGDFKPGTGDEFVLAVPGLAGLPAAFHAAVFALPVTVAAILLVSHAGKGRVDPATLDVLRLPSTPPAIRGPDF